VEKLIGPDFIPTWDSLVLKLPEEGIEVPWHRDAGADYVAHQPIFNVDIYLDEADLENCVWAYPGSNAWPADDVVKYTEKEGFETEGATPILMHAGDVLLHNILLLHGSPPSNSPNMRRVIYYEFRGAETEMEKGPHTLEYIPLKQKMLLKCLEHRRLAEHVAEEKPFEYNPPAPFHQTKLERGEQLETYRYLHQDYWRTGDRVG
jgi:ectoine hydroxylase-related dioxygenase (phytanoyl-CoA dioxygenase family)